MASRLAVHDAPRGSRPGSGANRGVQAADGGAKGKVRAERQTHETGAQGVERLARGLAWLGVGLGVAQVAAPGGVARLIGVRDDRQRRAVMRAVGLREIAAGAGILAQPQPTRWMWARVAGDVMDLALLGSAFSSDDTRRDRTALATAAVLGIAALDVVCARELSDGARAATTDGAYDRGLHATQTITINRRPEEVYAFWHEFQNLPRFMGHLESVEVLGARRSHWKAKAPAGLTVEWDADMVTDQPNELIAWRSVAGADVENSGSVRFSPAPGGRGTEVRVEIRYDVPAGPVGAAIAKLFGEEPGQQVRDDLRRFKQVLETGEVVRSDASPEGTGPGLLGQRAARAPTRELRA